jgi:3-oxoacyl-(acyl-carrier-protein) synthase
MFCCCVRAQSHAQVKDFTTADYFTNKKSARSNDKVTHFAMAAARLAIDDAGIDIAAAGERAGVMVGSAFGGMDTYVCQITVKITYQITSVTVSCYNMHVESALNSYTAWRSCVAVAAAATDRISTASAKH